MRPIVNLPVIEPLAPLPVVTRAGFCLVGKPDFSGAYLPTLDPLLGTTKAYLYGFFPGATPAEAQFWRYELAANVWERLADPITDLTTNVIGAATTMTYVANTSDARAVWLFHADSAIPYAQLRAYNVITDTWSRMAQAGGAINTVSGGTLGSAFAGGAAMVYPSPTVYPGLLPPPGLTANDRWLYIVGNNNTRVYRYNMGMADPPVAADSFTAVGTAAPRAGNAGTGCTFDWLPTSNADWLIGMRGGGSSAGDYYSIANDSWTVASPTTSLCGTGTSAAADLARDKIVVLPDGYPTYWGSGDGLFDWSVTPLGRWTALATLSRGNGTAHNGRSVVAVATSGQKWVYVAKHASTEFQRVLVVE